MSAANLDDQLKYAQVLKTNAEAQKLVKEAEAVGKPHRSDFWSETIKVLGSIVLGIGGVMVGYNQYELGELKTKQANSQLQQVVQAKVEAEKAKQLAEESSKSAILKRDQAIREQKEAEQSVEELRKEASQLHSELKSIKPGAIQSRLTYIQFRGEISRDLINELRVSLLGKSFNAPGAERVTGEYANQVKYFKPTQRKDAEELANSIELFFSNKGCSIKLRVMQQDGASIANPPLEAWIAHKCAK